MKYFWIIITLFLFSNCQQNNKTNAVVQDTQSLGVIDISVTGSAEAIPIFEEGLLLLHSFEYKDAAEKFKEAQQVDSLFAMAYWGEAMTKNHPLWRQQELDNAREILAKLGKTKADQKEKFKTPFEQDFFEAISILYGEGNKKERDEAYSDYMSVLHKKYPDNHEVAAFYALSLLGSNESGRDADLYQKGALIAKSVIEENPKHPGALHYLIHSYDDPENASKALSAANSYSNIAPDAAHALHMPSHIYVAMGMWDEVISSNIASWEASVNRKNKKGLGVNSLNYHALKWLMYGHLQKGDFDNAKKLVVDMEKYCYEDPTSKAVSHNVMMKAAYFSESNEWGDSLVLDSIDYSDLPIQIQGAHSFKMAKKALFDNDVDKVKVIIQDLKEKIGNAVNEVLIGNPMMCSGSYSRGRPTQIHVDRSRVIKLEIESLLAFKENNDALGEKILLEAIALEDKTTYMYGPPEIVKPSREMYAEWLISVGRKQEAEDHFGKVLDRAPGRRLASQL